MINSILRKNKTFNRTIEISKNLHTLTNQGPWVMSTFWNNIKYKHFEINNYKSKSVYVHYLEIVFISYRLSPSDAQLVITPSSQPSTTKLNWQFHLLLITHKNKIRKYKNNCDCWKIVSLKFRFCFVCLSANWLVGCCRCYSFVAVICFVHCEIWSQLNLK